MAANLRKVGYNTKKIILFYCPTMNIFLLKSHKFITFFIENDGGLKFFVYICNRNRGEIRFQ